MTTIYITKWCNSGAIRIAEVKDDELQKPGIVLPGTYIWVAKKYFTTDRAEAEKRAKEMRGKRKKALEKAITNLEKLKIW